MIFILTWAYLFFRYSGYLWTSLHLYVRVKRTWCRHIGYRTHCNRLWTHYSAWIWIIFILRRVWCKVFSSGKLASSVPWKKSENKNYRKL